MKKLIIIMAFVAIYIPEIKAQQDPLLTQYMFNGLLLNPAYAGSRPYWSSTLTFRNQWVGFEGAPKTGIVSLDGPLHSDNMGLGALIVHDRVGVSSQNTMVLNYSYSIKLNNVSKFSFGVMLDLISTVRNLLT